MNPNVKTKLDVLMAEHEAKQLKIQQIFDSIKDDFMACAYFRAKTSNSFSFPYFKLTELLVEKGFVNKHTSQHLMVSIARCNIPLIELCKNELVKNGFVKNGCYLWELKTVLNDINEPPAPPPVTTVELSEAVEGLYHWIAFLLAAIIITTVCTL